MEPREIRFQISASSVLRYLSYAVGILFVISAICELTADFGSGGAKAAAFFTDLGYAAFFGGLLYAFSHIIPWMMEWLRR